MKNDLENLDKIKELISALKGNTGDILDTLKKTTRSVGVKIHIPLFDIKQKSLLRLKLANIWCDIARRELSKRNILPEVRLAFAREFTKSHFSDALKVYGNDMVSSKHEEGIEKLISIQTKQMFSAFDEFNKANDLAVGQIVLNQMPKEYLESFKKTGDLSVGCMPLNKTSEEEDEINLALAMSKSYTRYIAGDFGVRDLENFATALLMVQIMLAQTIKDFSNNMSRNTQEDVRA